MIRLIACDIDGTLLRGTQREISPAVFREVVRLGKQGVRFCPASGRQYHSLRGLFAPIASRLYYVCENGAVVFGPGDPGPILAKETMEREQALELCREILDMDGCEVLISGAGISYLCPKEGDIVDHVRYSVGNRTALVDRPEEIDVHQVFRRFYKADAARTHTSTGLGLAIVKHIVQLYGGTLTLESAVGKGSTFTVTLPLAKDNA